MRRKAEDDADRAIDTAAVTQAGRKKAETPEGKRCCRSLSVDVGDASTRKLRVLLACGEVSGGEGREVMPGTRPVGWTKGKGAKKQ